MAFPTLDFPPFTPHPLIPTGHLQTLFALRDVPLQISAPTQQYIIPIIDGDRTILHDDRPALWKNGDPAVLLVHGLAGDCDSPYMRRMSARLTARGVRVLRLELRSAGAALGISRGSYHAGRSEDALSALNWFFERNPDSKIVIIGFSLGGNLILKLLGELGEEPPPGLVGAVSVCPPIDIHSSMLFVERAQARVYQIYFLHFLLDQFSLLQKHLAIARELDLPGKPRSIREFDQMVTVPLGGFASVEEYYELASASKLLQRIAVPTLILAARNDPLIPPGIFEQASFSRFIRLELMESGGHLGFLARDREGPDPDGRWMDWRIIEWVDTLVR